MVVGWATSGQMKASLAVRALEMAKGRGYVAKGAIFHSDRGSQHTSRLLAEWAYANDVRLSVGLTGSCHDNAVGESFLATMKKEMCSRRRWATRMDARMAVYGCIEGCCNRRRPHSIIDYRFPADLMDEFFACTAGCQQEPRELPLAA